MNESTKLLNDLEDARQDLKDLQRTEKKARQAFATGVGTLTAMTGMIALTGNGIYAWALFPAFAFFCLSLAYFYSIFKTSQNGNYSWDRTEAGRLEMAKRRVRHLERAYAEAVMQEASKS